MAGTLVLTDTVAKTFDDLFGDVYRQTDVVVRGQAVFDAGTQASGSSAAGSTSRSSPTSARCPVSRRRQGGVFGYARLDRQRRQGDRQPRDRRPDPGRRTGPSPRQLNPFQLVEGSPPAADDEVVIDAQSAKVGKLAVGDTTTVLVQGPPLRVRISGIAKFGTVDSPGGATVALFRTTVAQQLIAEPGKFDSISVVADAGVTQTELAAPRRQGAAARTSRPSPARR